jgi:hypothetical protein
VCEIRSQLHTTKDKSRPQKQPTLDTAHHFLRSV